MRFLARHRGLAPGDADTLGVMTVPKEMFTGAVFEIQAFAGYLAERLETEGLERASAGEVETVVAATTAGLAGPKVAVIGSSDDADFHRLVYGNGVFTLRYTEGRWSGYTRVRIVGYDEEDNLAWLYGDLVAVAADMSGEALLYDRRRTRLQNFEWEPAPAPAVAALA